MAAVSMENENIECGDTHMEEFRSSVETYEWDKVLKIYEECHHPEKLQRLKINRSDERALHMALRPFDKRKVLLAQKKDKKKVHVAATTLQKKKVQVAEKLIDGLQSVGLEELADKRGNTPLHVAAKMEDQQKMCVSMAHKQPDRIGDRNKDYETPLFLAALYGCKDSFLRLSEICCSDHKIYEYGRRSSDGSTVLHCAVNEEYFDLAWEIIHRFPNFVHYVDERGYSPLHLLARKPSAFESGRRLTWLQAIIYNYIPEKIWMGTKDRVHQLDVAHSEERGWKIMKSFLNPMVETLEMKEKHWGSIQITDAVLRVVESHTYADNGCKPTSNPHSDDIFERFRIWNECLYDTSQDNQEKKDSQVSSESSQKNKTEQATPILFAAKNGISELVDKILKTFPEAIYDVNSEGKNVMLLALENRKTEVYNKLDRDTKDLLHHNDNDGNNALHHAAMVGTYPPWIAPKAVLQMQWEIKWYESITEPLPKNMLAHQNNKGMNPDQVFMDTHSELVKNDTDWLMKTSDSCTIVAALIATVAFATSASLPGGISGDGEPTLQRQRMFEVFAISSLVALCFSLIAVVMFLTILTSRHQAMDFRDNLPRKLLIGLTALFISIASMLVSFCGGHFFVLRNILRRAQVVEYLVAFLPVAFFVIAQCPLYFKLFVATVFKKNP